MARRKTPAPPPPPPDPGAVCPNCDGQVRVADPMCAYWEQPKREPHENPFDCIRQLRSDVEHLRSEVKSIRDDLRQVEDQLPRP